MSLFRWCGRIAVLVAAAAPIAVPIAVTGCADVRPGDDLGELEDIGARRDFARLPIDLTMAPKDAGGDLSMADMTGRDLANPATDSGSTDSGSTGDMTTAADLGMAGSTDMATAGSTDMAVAKDMAVAADLAVAKDMAAVVDMSVAMDLSAKPDLVVVRDLATPNDLVVAHDLVSASDGGVACHPVLNEVQTGTTASGIEEFIEIFNPCGTAIDLTGWSISYRASSNVKTDPTSAGDSLGGVLYPDGDKVPAGGFYVVCEDSFTETCDASYTGGFMANGSGSLALRDPADNIVDSMAYGTVMSGNLFIETAPAPTAPTGASPGQSLGRLPNGTDTNDNSADWKKTTAITPDGANR